MFTVELYAGIRRAVMVDGLSRREAVWRSSQHDFKDAAVFCPAGLSAAGATGLKEAGSLHGLDRQGPGGRQERPRQAASYGTSDIRASAVSERLFYRLHDRAYESRVNNPSQKRPIYLIIG